MSPCFRVYPSRNAVQDAQGQATRTPDRGQASVASSGRRSPGGPQ